jgi:hypothetical protein
MSRFRRRKGGDFDKSTGACRPEIPGIIELRMKMMARQLLYNDDEGRQRLSRVIAGRMDGGTNESLDWGTTSGLAFAASTREEPRPGTSVSPAKEGLEWPLARMMHL